jgi:hypothetical protein
VVVIPVVTSSESVAKGNKALGFIRRNVGSCPEEVKKQAYLAQIKMDKNNRTKYCVVIYS